MTTQVFYGILKDLYDCGQDVVSRGLKTREILGYTYVLPPRVRFCCFDERKLKIDYIKQEFMWYLVGEPKDHSICELATMWKDLINADQTINSNYGYYIFNPRAGKDNQSNFERVFETLRSDPQSRRAVITILTNDHLNSETKDYPCTAYINYLIRDNQLHQFVRMRSQDAIYGMGNDAPFFSMLHELLFVLLKKYIPDLELGTYKHGADSFHVYEKHFGMLEKIVLNPTVSKDEHHHCPKMTPMTYIYLKALRYDLLNHSITKPTVYDDRFLQWLMKRENSDSFLAPRIV